jgi:type II secretion system protein G
LEKGSILEMDMKKGFTLIEIMVVIAILGILIAMASASYVASLKKGRDLKRKSDVVQIGKALELYFTDNGRYPAAASGANEGKILGCTDPNDPGVCDWGAIWMNKIAIPNIIYMAKLPSDPNASQHYYYDSDAAGTYYQIYALLENKDDKDLNKNGTTVRTYTGTTCAPSLGCTYGTSSTNKTPEDGHALN